MKKFLAVTFCVILTGCSFLNKHNDLIEQTKKLEKQAIDDFSTDSKELVDKSLKKKHSDSTSIDALSKNDEKKD